MTRRLLAVEWDRREVRVAVADAVGRRCTIVDSFVLAHAADTEMGPAQVSESGSRLAQMLSDRDIRCRDVMVVMGRTGTELRVLTVPPAPEHELPALVRFQALRQFSSLDDNGPLDYFPLAVPPAEGADATRRVLAASISPVVVQQVQAWCRAAGLKPQRMLLRPCTLASWWRSSTGGPQKSRSVRLLVRLLADEADLVVLQGGEILVMRSVRMPEASPETTDHRSLASRWVDVLLPEIRRTLGAIDHHDTADGAAAGGVTLCGEPEVVMALQDRLESALGWPVDFLGVDPSPAAPSPIRGPAFVSGISAAAPNVVRFAPLYGALQDEAAERPPEIDFLNPRRAPPPVSHRRRWIAAVTATLMILTFGTGYATRERARLDRQIEDLAARSKSLDRAVAQSNGLISQTKQLNGWAARDINWLEELWYLSKSLPEPGQVRVTGLEMRALDQGGGSALLTAMATQSEQIAATENRLRDIHHVVRGEGGTFNKKSPDEKYPWTFRINLDVKGKAP